MIYEQIPELHTLNREEMATLATELLHEASKPGPGEPDPAIVSLLRKRQAEHRANPDAVFTWEQVKARATGKNG